MLEIIYRDEHFLAINKPHGLLVHRSRIAKDATEFALQMLRDQIEQTVYPVHRLDRKTGGVLLFALDEVTHKKTQELFAHNLVRKRYLAIVRGYTEDAVEIDYPLRKENGKLQEAYTEFSTVSRAELDIPFGRYLTARYSLLNVQPKTGRMHQIRKHLSHIRHPIIGDRPHGCNKQNRFFKERWQMDTMLLHAYQLEFTHPIKNNAVLIRAGLQSEFQRMMDLMHWQSSFDK
ncbi:tRNA pseudouridine65 synthase [Catalinimonas alkaloidigena]|uniref:pseudouridine synthase n=1 Tax=Catalinimonas alkaloidigena TaxID=1075417 RepID=UPI002405AAB2|nr:pseudouridine synthase [Catalinimonas alkaloidigena]MDF9797621.1 tRNA pseudouridine65 synthase [Catalinimonas alkaloidigena]